MRENYIGIPIPVCDERLVREHYRLLTLKLIEKGLTISTMESATGGQIASLITDTEGASRIIKGAFVTYSNEAKIMQGVPANIIDEYSVYSKETALSMASSCQKIYNSDIGIGVTGTIGSVDSENRKNSVPGEVYFAICVGQESYSYLKIIPPQPNRLLYKLFVADMIYRELDKLL